TCFPASEI
ncbi:hypothetical protein AVEN_221231-1, partial [Araneus ventricosus]